MLHDGDWCLPRLEYSEHATYTARDCARDLQGSLGIKPAVASYFQVVAELMPEGGESHTMFYNPDGVRLTLLAAPSEFYTVCELPPHACWMPIEEFRDAVESPLGGWLYSSAQNAALLFADLLAVDDVRTVAVDPRGDVWWTHRASAYLLSVVRGLQLEPLSAVTRSSWDSSSELFMVRTSNGSYYLKAPSPGCAEVAVTEYLCRIFAEDTLRVVAVNAALNCFVAEGFDELGSGPVLPPLGPDDYANIVRKWSAMQLRSTHCLEDLRQAGVPDYSPAVLSSLVDGLVQDPTVAAALEGEMSTDDFVCGAMRVCAKLEASALPVSLVHGDLTTGNVGRKRDGGLLIFDWQHAYLSHPFCHSYLPRDLLRSPPVRRAYLDCWSALVCREQAEAELTAAAVVGGLAALHWYVSLLPTASRVQRRRLVTMTRCSVRSLLGDLRAL